MSNLSINNVSINSQGEASGQTERSNQTEATKSQEQSSASSSFIDNALNQRCCEIESMKNSFQQIPLRDWVKTGACNLAESAKGDQDQRGT